MENNNNKISQAYANSLAGDRHSLYSAILRNQYFAPRQKDQIMSIQFMVGVQQGEFWLPKTHEVRLKNCADPPPKHEVAAIVADKLSNYRNVDDNYLRSMQATARRIRQNPPGNTWLLAILASMDGDHQLFAKDYVRPKPQFGQERDLNEIEDKNGFFAGLPDNQPKRGKKRGNGINFIKRHDQIAKENQEIFASSSSNRLSINVAQNQEEEKKEVRVKPDGAINVIGNEGEDQEYFVQQRDVPNSLIPDNESHVDDTELKDLMPLGAATSISSARQSRKKPMPTRRSLKKDKLLSAAADATSREMSKMMLHVESENAQLPELSEPTGMVNAAMENE